MNKRRMSKTIGTKKRKQLEKEQDAVRDWAGLPDYLIELVIERLPFVDCLSFSGVCKPWRSTTTEFFDGCARGIPYYVKPHQPENTRINCFNIIENSSKEIQLPQAHGSYIWGSFQDWLFLGKYRRLSIRRSLLNPFSGENILLPDTDDCYQMMVVSKVPTDQRCVYMLVNADSEVAFWVLGNRKWHKMEFFDLLYDRKVFGRSYSIFDALYHEGSFYLLTEDYRLVIIDEKSVFSMLSADNDDDSSIMRQLLPVKFPDRALSRFVRRYLVESCGNILLICRFIHNDSRPYNCSTFAFKTYKLDLSQMAWVELGSLGRDQILFVGKSCSRSLCTKELGDALGNKIYFSNNNSDHRLMEWDSLRNYVVEDDVDVWGVFSYEEPSHWPRAFRKLGKRWPGVWLTAPMWWCLKQRHGC